MREGKWEGHEWMNVMIKLIKHQMRKVSLQCRCIYLLSFTHGVPLCAVQWKLIAHICPCTENTESAVAAAACGAQILCV